jgi:hypothetical protein
MEVINRIFGLAFENSLLDWTLLLWVAAMIILVVIILFNSFRTLWLIHKIKR